MQIVKILPKLNDTLSFANSVCVCGGGGGGESRGWSFQNNNLGSHSSEPHLFTVTLLFLS